MKELFFLLIGDGNQYIFFHIKILYNTIQHFICWSNVSSFKLYMRGKECFYNMTKQRMDQWKKNIMAYKLCNYAPFLWTHGLMTVTTMIIIKMRSIKIATHIHFLEFFWSFLAFWSALLPCCTWSTALETWFKVRNQIWSQITNITFHQSNFHSN